jgi:hypothetical protein
MQPFTNCGEEMQYQNACCISLFLDPVSLQPRMHQMPLCNPKNKNIEQDYLKGSDL